MQWLSEDDDMERDAGEEEGAQVVRLSDAEMEAVGRVRLICE